VEDWLGEHADSLIEHWMNYNAKHSVEEIVTEKVESMSFTVSAKAL
jgi:hypothetical protein